MLGYSIALQDAQIDQITTQADAALDANGAIIPASIALFGSTRPANGTALGASDLPLCIFTTSAPMLGVSANGTATAGAIADALGTVDAGTGVVATWFRVVGGNGTFVMDGDVGLSGTDANGVALSTAEMLMPTTTISQNLTVSVSSFTVSSGNTGI